MTLRPYQIEAVHAAQKNDRIILCAPTGAGKTIIAVQIIQNAVSQNKSVLFVAHRRELINQCSKKLAKHGIDHGVIMPGSPNVDSPVQVASIQTLTRRGYPPAEMCIIDECHHAAASTYRPLLKNYKQVIGLSATPSRHDSKLLQKLGPIYHVAQIVDLIADNHLVCPEVYACGDKDRDLSSVGVSHGDYNIGELSNKMDTETLNQEILDHWLKHASHTKTVVFATNVDHSKHIAKMFSDAGYPAVHVDWQTKNREQLVRSWATGRFQIVTNCGIFTEGFDMPELECVILARPTKSLSLYLQMVGRVMRPHLSKTKSIVLDHTGSTMSYGHPCENREWRLPNSWQCPECLEEKSCEVKSITHKLQRRNHEFNIKCCAQHQPSLKFCTMCGAVQCIACGHITAGHNYNVLYEFEDGDESLESIEGAYLITNRKLLEVCSNSSVDIDEFLAKPVGCNVPSYQRIMEIIECPKCKAVYTSEKTVSGDEFSWSGGNKDPATVEREELIETRPSWEKDPATVNEELLLEFTPEFVECLSMAKASGSRRNFAKLKLESMLGQSEASKHLPEKPRTWWLQKA